MALNPLLPEEETLTPLAGDKPKIPDFIPEAPTKAPGTSLRSAGEDRRLHP